MSSPQDHTADPSARSQIDEREEQLLDDPAHLQEQLIEAFLR